MRQIRSRTRAVNTLSLAFVAHAGATATYDYKLGEFLVIDIRTSPDKMFSIVSGENRAGEFGVFLRDVQTKKLIGQLEEVATGLNSAPDAFHAHWVPDCKHVGITSRADRHWADNAIYRIENRHAYPVKTPKLLYQAVPDREHPNRVYRRSYSAIVKWISPMRFVVSEESQWQVEERDPSATLGQYGEAEKSEDESDESAALYHVWFDAEG